MDLHTPRRHRLEMPRRLDQLLRPRLIEKPLWAHPADDPPAPDRDVAVLVRQQDRWADPLIAAASRVGPVYPRHHRDPHLLELRMSEEAGPLTSPVCIDLLLLRKLHSRAVHQPNQRQVHDLRDVRHPEVVLRLSRDPRPRNPLVVEPDQDAPLSPDPGQTVHDPRASRFLVLRVEYRVHRAERPRVHQVLDPLPDRHLPPFVDQVYRNAHIPDPLLLGFDLLHDRLGLRRVGLHPLDLCGPQRLPDIVHFGKIRSHIFLLPFNDCLSAQWLISQCYSQLTKAPINTECGIYIHFRFRKCTDILSFHYLFNIHGSQPYLCLAFTIPQARSPFPSWPSPHSGFRATPQA